ncbi:AMP phosphorylase [Halorussus caseinilyticus]|uniref:AMP phosphorylase n=1 Tax=Halorussus caseinilyticus TaxID=3034025 RepID=UPI0023E82D32|nr:AMP phosphorylase [Halorussus sp. DT72]
MELVASEIDIGTHLPTVLLNGADAEELGVHPLDRVQITTDGTTTIGIVEMTDELVAPGTLGVTRRLGHVEGRVEVTHAPKPNSARYVRKKLDDRELEADEIRAIVRDIEADRLNDVELSAYVSGVYSNGMSDAETTHLTEAMAEVGDHISWDDPVVADKHSIGGVAGNRVSPILVPIVAAAGVKIPKTSSRAVTSPAGTADTMEVFCGVEFSVGEIRDIVAETNGCLVWGGAVDLSPVDDKIIRAENPLSLDPTGQLIASVLSKKHCAGSTHVVVDVPYGEGSKVDGTAEARELADDFERVGDHLGMEVTPAVSPGDEPIGRGIGPVLEARDVLAVLAGDGPEDLRLKAVRLAEVLLDDCDVDADAAEILESGRAEAAFRDIVAAQGGDPDVTLADLVPGDERATIEADRSGVVTHVDNRLVSELGRRAGAPKDQRAGLTLARRVDDEVSAGDELFTVYAETASKLEDAVALADRAEPVRVRSREEAMVERV